MNRTPRNKAPAEKPIDIGNHKMLEAWAEKLDATVTQIRDAVAAVGNNPADVELHLKGSRSSTNSERVAEQTH